MGSVEESTNVIQLRDKLQRLLTDEFGGVNVDRDGDFSISADSTRVFVRAQAWGKDETLVRIFSPVLLGLAPSTELYKYVAKENQYHFGTLVLFENEAGDEAVLELKHTLLGDYLDPQELISAVIAVGATADQLDDELLARFGGRRFTDAAS